MGQSVGEQGLHKTYFPEIYFSSSLRGCVFLGASFDVFILQTAFTTKKDYGRGEREAQWAIAQRTLHGLEAPEAIFSDKNSYRELSEIAEQAKRRAEVAR